MSIDPAELGTRIRAAREARGLSRKQLADLAGIGKTAQFDLEHGNGGVRLNTLLSVLTVLDMQLDLVDPDALSDPPPPVWRPPEETGDLPDRLL